MRRWLADNVLTFSRPRLLFWWAVAALVMSTALRDSIVVIQLLSLYAVLVSEQTGLEARRGKDAAKEAAGE